MTNKQYSKNYQLEHGKTYFPLVEDASDVKYHLKKVELPEEIEKIVHITKTPDLFKKSPDSFKNLDVKIIWLTELSRLKDYTAYNPKDIEKILSKLDEKINKKNNQFIVLDGLEYLRLYHHGDTVYKFTSSLSDKVQTSKNILMIPINENAFIETEANSLKRLGTIIR